MIDCSESVGENRYSLEIVITYTNSRIKFTILGHSVQVCCACQVELYLWLSIYVASVYWVSNKGYHAKTKDVTGNLKLSLTGFYYVKMSTLKS